MVKEAHMADTQTSQMQDSGGINAEPIAFNIKLM